MNVLSLFDGISCGQLALQRAKIPYTKYLASEIEPHAISVTQYRHPNTIQLGDVTNWAQWDLPKIDLLFAGFPCQAWSTAGKQKKLDDPRGRLALTLSNIFRFIPVKYFLFENVCMSSADIRMLDGLFGVSSVTIDSALLSGQSRPRVYWTNIPNITIPEDKGIMVQDILEPEADKWLELENLPILRNGVLSYNYKWHIRKGRCKSFTLLADANVRKSLIVINNKIRRLTPLEYERLQTMPDNYTDILTDNQRYSTIGNAWTIDVIAHLLRGIHDTKN